MTTNGNFGVPLGTPDFSASAPADKQLTIGFEVQNALNGGGSSVAKHRITWKVPQQLLKSASILSGGALEDGSEGSPATTGFRWYFSPGPRRRGRRGRAPPRARLHGPTCAPTSFTQPGQTSPGLQRPGSYRYWVSVPYRGGFRTAECPGLDGRPARATPRRPSPSRTSSFRSRPDVGRRRDPVGQRHEHVEEGGQRPALPLRRPASRTTSAS